MSEERQLNNTRFCDLSKINKNKQGRYDWKNSVGKYILFKYNDTSGKCRIEKYIGNGHVVLNYNDCHFVKSTESIKNCNFADVIYSRIKNDKDNPIPYFNCKYAKQGDYIKTNNSIIRVIKRSTNRIEYECIKCHYLGEKRIGKLSSTGSGCPVCSNQIVKIGFNDIWTTNKKLARKLFNSDEGYKYTQNSNHKTDWKCDRCKEKVEGVSIKNTNNTGRILCPLCSKSISFPNKFADAVFKQSKISYEREIQKPEWFNGIRRRYDFLIDNTFIELDGGIGHGNSTCYNSNIEDQIKIDKEKDEQAIKHGYNIVRINCDYKSNRFEFMKQALFSNEFIKTHINIENIDFEKIYNSIETPLLDLCIDYWKNTKLSPEEIANELKVNVFTVRRYLHIANNKGKIEYDRKNSWYRTRHMDKPQKFESNYNLGRKPVRIIFKNGSEMNFKSLLDMRTQLNILKPEYKSWKENKKYNYKKEDKKIFFESIQTIYEKGIIVYEAS